MASTMRRRLRVVQYRMQRLKTSPLMEDVCAKDEPRVHTIFDMILVAMSTVFPFGVFVISGHVVKDLAGPSALLSLIFASLASGLAGLSYSELRARVHRVQGSAYQYTYRLIGEATAFLIGWLLVLHHVTCASAVARAISQNLDYLLENRISNLTVAHLGSLPSIDSYLDFVAFFISLLTMIASVLELSIDGHKIRMLSVVSSLVTILFLLVVGLYHLNFRRWQKISVFFPHGIGGVMGGAAVLSYAFWSSETILRSSDLNSRGLRKPVMVAILSVHISSTVVLALTTSAMTLLTDGWQTDAPLIESFASTSGLSWLRYVACPTAMFVLSPVLCHQYRQSVTSLRHLAADGLLPAAFSTGGSSSTSTTDAPPLSAVVAVGAVCSLCSLVFSVSWIARIVAVPVIVIHILACATTVCFHYKPEEEEEEDGAREDGGGGGVSSKRTSTNRRRSEKVKRANSPRTNGIVSRTCSGFGGVRSPAAATSSGSSYGATVRASADRSLTADGGVTSSTSGAAPDRPPASSSTTGAAADDDSSSDTDIDGVVDEYEHDLCVRQLRENAPPADFRKRSDASSFRRVRAALFAFLCTSLALGLLVCDGGDELKTHKLVMIVLLTLCTLATIGSAVVMARQPRDLIQPYTVMMYVHHVPWTPLVALVMNVMMFSAINVYSALVIFVWTLLGFSIYIFYGMSHSHEAMYPDEHPEEERELIGQIPTEQSRQLSNSAADISQEFITDRDDECLLDCS